MGIFMKKEFVLNNKSVLKYGYFLFSKNENELLKKIFPDGEFTVYFEGQELSNRKMNWKLLRLNLYPLRKKFTEGDVLIFSRKGDNILIEKKKNDKLLKT